MKKEILLEKNFTIIPGNFELAGRSSSDIKYVLKKIGIDQELIRRVCIACYEAEMNIVIYTYGGSIKLKVFSDEIIVIAQDSGPGIADIEVVLKDGYSTASNYVLSQGFGAGRGLSNIKRYADTFFINSIIGSGTKMELCFKISNI